MSMKYRADCAACDLPQQASVSPVYEELYRVPAGCTAKLTYLKGLRSDGGIAVSKDGGTTKILAVSTPGTLSLDAVNMGVYFNENDILYGVGTGYRDQYFICVILEEQLEEEN